MVISVAAVILIILILVLIAPVKALAEYVNGDFSLSVYLYGLKVYKSEKKDKSLSQESRRKAEKFEKDAKSISLKLSDFIELCKTAVKLLRKYVVVDNVKLRINVGTGDAAITAVSTGALWAAVYGLLGIIGQIVYINEHKVEITPDYANDVFSIDGKCIIKSRMVYIIIIAITILMKINSRKGKEE